MVCICGWEIISILENDVHISNGDLSITPPKVKISDWIRQVTDQRGFPYNFRDYIREKYLNETLSLLDKMTDDPLSYEGYFSNLSTIPSPPLVKIRNER